MREILRRSADTECWTGKGRWCEIHLPEEERKVWTPYLSIRADHEPEGSSLFARFAPRPEVWTSKVLVWLAVLPVVRSSIVTVIR